MTYSTIILVLFFIATTNAAATTQNDDPTLQQFLDPLANLPPLQLTIHVHRKAMQVHGQSTLRAFVIPIVSPANGSVYYNGFTTFRAGESNFTYTLIDGAVYLVTEKSSASTTTKSVECFPTATWINSIVPSLNNATRIPSASIGNKTILCDTGKMFKTSVVGQDVALCASDQNGFIAYGKDITIEVKYLNSSPPGITKPESIGDNKMCGANASPATQITPVAAMLLTGNSSLDSGSRNLRVAEHMDVDSDTCECKSAPRPCVFFHGIGNRHEMEELQDTPKNTSGRMGNMNDHAPCCSSVKYAVLNTVDYGWTNDELQQKFCDRALSVSDTSDSTSHIIQDTVVITHSMGGLVMAGAVATGKCSFGNSSSWVSISAPMMGSMAADYIEDVCNDEVSNFKTGLFDLLGYCPVPVSRKSITYQNGAFSSPELNAAYTAAQEAYGANVYAAMCSNYYVGVVSQYQVQSIIAGKVIPHKSRENDGLVEFQSCAAGLSQSLFGDSYEYRFYSPKLNHADTAFLTHDGFFKDSQKPFKWFECLL